MKKPGFLSSNFVMGQVIFDFFEVFVQLFGAREVELVAVVSTVIVTIVFLVSAADAGPMLVDVAAVDLVEVLAAASDIDVPVAVFHKDADAFMGQIPPDIVVVAGRGGRLDGQGQISAAQTGAFLTEHFVQDLLLSTKVTSDAALTAVATIIGPTAQPRQRRS